MGTAESRSFSVKSVDTAKWSGNGYSAYCPTIIFDTSFPEYAKCTNASVKCVFYQAEGTQYSQLSVKLYPSLGSGLYDNAHLLASLTVNVGEYYSIALDMTDSGNWLDNAINHGIYFEVSSYGMVDIYWNKPSMIVSYEQGEIPINIIAPKSSISKGAVYDIEWDVDLKSYGTILYQTIELGTAQTVDANTRKVRIDTGSLSGNSVLLKITAVSSTNIFTTVEERLTINSPSTSVTELYPTGNTEQGTPQVFRWHLNVNTPDGAVGVNVYQTSAEVQYRPAGATEYSSVTVSGSSETVTLAGDVLPVGDIEWRVVVHTNVGFDTASSWKSCTNIKNTITPVLSSPSGTISKGGIYRLQWTYQASTSAGVCAGTVIEYKPIGADASRVTLEAGATTFDLDTGAINSMEGMMWRVMATSDSGNDTWCEWRTNYFSSPSMSIGELFPTGTVYHGFDVTFRWALSVSLPSGALRVNVSQNGGELRYRLQGESGYSTAIISGAAQTVTIGGSVLPIGVVEWQVLLHTNVGYDCVSSWQTCRNEEVSITVTDLSPGTEGRAPRGVSNRFSWSFVPEGVEDLPGPITQVSATLYWKSAALTAYHTVSVEGENKFADIPAGTFDGLEEIDWYVVAKASTGTTGTSEVVRVSTLDTLSNPAAISPAGVFLDDAVEGLTFLWQHANQTGTPQCGYELDYSSDSGASYTTLHAGEDDAQSWTSAPGTFPNTTIYWRVRTKNTDGVFGRWSSPAIFAIRRLPDAPAITYLDAKPLPAIGWQSETQTGYEVELDGVSYGMRHGTEKQWRSPALLADGEHTIRVRIINLYRDISPWAATTFLVANKPAGTCRVLAEEQFGQVVLVAECEGDFRSVMLLRDDKPMALLSPGQTYIDRTGVGSHIYMLRAFDANGYYTDSAACCAAPRVPYGALGLLDGDGWTLLKWSPSRDRYAKSLTETGSFVQYYGSNRPVWRGTGCLTAVHRMTYCFKKGDDLRSIEALRGSIVVYKDYEGHLAIGVFEAVPITAQNGLPCVEISITETQQEEIDYGGV